MKKITLEKEELLGEFLSIFAIGLTYCLDKDLLHPSRAEGWLFSSSIALSVKTLEKNKIDISLRNALEYASELEACYGADYYKKCIDIARSKFVEILKNSVNNNDYKDEKIRSVFLDIFQ